MDDIQIGDWELDELAVVIAHADTAEERIQKEKWALSLAYVEGNRHGMNRAKAWCEETVERLTPARGVRMELTEREA